MQAFMTFIGQHGWVVIIAYFMFASLVGSMPPLPKDAGYTLTWVYGFLHLFAGNVRTWTQMAGLKMPGGTNEPTTDQKL